jgi:hypothetical protein
MPYSWIGRSGPGAGVLLGNDKSVLRSFAGLGTINAQGPGMQERRVARRHLAHSFTARAPSAVVPRRSAASETPPISAQPRRLARGSYASKFPVSCV